MDGGKSQYARSKWIVVALAPSVLSSLLTAVFATMLVHTASTQSAAERGMWMVDFILYTPLVVPLYLYPIGRKYVRALHGHFAKSAIPFVLFYSAANLVVWAVSVCIVGFNMHFP